MSQNTAIRFYDLHPPQTDHIGETIEGLSKKQKQLPPKLFYDEKGSKIFDQICEQPEYYPTRTEIEILRQNAREIAEYCSDNNLLLELGSGASKKIRILLETLRPNSYVGVDISKEFLIESTTRLAKDYPWLDVHATCADFSHDLDLTHCPDNQRILAFFPGSSIGNFTPTEAQLFLGRLHKLIGPGGLLLIGVDLVKDIDILNAAYNDSHGVTARFNLNLLERLNFELDANFDLERFQHYAFFNPHHSRIEMHLVSRDEQTVHLGPHRFDFRKGESIHTENSYKYTIDGFEEMARNTGWRPVKFWTDDAQKFSIQLFSTE
ncbi:MAG: L-histidine N(alpha)-methyltransferase [Gammaproteobacteria bacterium]|nr:L-histidine N(alpha)-methyltransferase [Gammaproteobacteria bacterium]